jgi:hypothetical protein
MLIGRFRNGFVPLFLLATSLAGGPGLAGVEAYEHAHRVGPGHGHRIHFERRGGQDHDDTCRAWLTSAPARTPTRPATVGRLTEVAVTPHLSPAPSVRSADPTLLPHSRAPPASA